MSDHRTDIYDHAHLIIVFLNKKLIQSWMHHELNMNRLSVIESSCLNHITWKSEIFGQHGSRCIAVGLAQVRSAHGNSLPRHLHPPPENVKICWIPLSRHVGFDVNIVNVLILKGTNNKMRKWEARHIRPLSMTSYSHFSSPSPQKSL